MKLTNTQESKVYYKANRLFKKKPHLRFGQCYFISLHELFHDIAESVTGTDYDCFYVDMKLPKLRKYLVKGEK